MLFKFPIFTMVFHQCTSEDKLIPFINEKKTKSIDNATMVTIVVLISSTLQRCLSITYYPCFVFGIVVFLLFIVAGEQAAGTVARSEVSSSNSLATLRSPADVLIAVDI